MRLLEEGVFPVRFLGFGFFWAWLFIAGLSPSPLFGSPLCVGGIPFELFELLMRCAMLAISLTLSCVIATDRGKYCFLALGAVAGIAVTPLLLWGGSEEAHSVAALLTAMTEVSLFLMWLSFFGAMRLGDTLTLLVISYGVGALLFLVALMGGERTLLGASIVFPLLSAAALVFSSRLISRRGGTALFDNESTEPLKDEALSEETSIRNVTKSIPALKMTLALVCYSLATRAGLRPFPTPSPPRAVFASSPTTLGAGIRPTGPIGTRPSAPTWPVWLGATVSPSATPTPCATAPRTTTTGIGIR